jgi:hypothetical protein
MRWTKRKPLNPNDRRTKCFFALFPVRVDREIRWLELVKVVQMYDGYYWRSIKFLN